MPGLSVPLFLVIGSDPFKKVRSIQHLVKALRVQKSIDVTGLVPFIHIPDPDHHALILPLFGSLCFLQAVLGICDLLLLIRDLLFQIRQIIADLRQLTVQIIQLSLEGILLSLQVLQIIIFLIQLVLQFIFLLLFLLNLLPGTAGSFYFDVF